MSNFACVKATTNPHRPCGAPRRSEVPSIELIKQLFAVDFDSGALTFLPRDRAYFKSNRSHAHFNKNRVGTVAGSRRGEYLRVEVFGNAINAHWIVWALVHGEWPSLEIDHINGVGTDNRPANLRLATRAQNCWNTGIRGATYKGVVRPSNSRSKWRAQIWDGSRNVNLGSFESEDLAIEARVAAEKAMRGDFMRGCK